MDDTSRRYLWLVEALAKERQEQERRHQLLLAGFAKRFPEFDDSVPFEHNAPGEVEVDGHLPTLLTTTAGPSGCVPATTPRLSRESRVSVTSSIETETAGRNRWLWKRDVFDIMSNALILASSLCLAFETEYVGLQSGYDMEYANYELTAAEAWPSADVAFTYLDWFFVILFSLELLVNVSLQRKQFFKELWNWLDVTIVLLSIVDKVVASSLPVDPMVLRLARLGRILRALRLIHTIREFDPLFVMTTAIKSSVSILFWSFVLLFAIQLMLALVMNQAIAPFIADANIPIDTRRELFKYFGSCSRAVLTMFELTLANWAPVAHLLQDGCGQYWILFSIAHKMSIGLALIGVINGIFMQETFKVASSDDMIMKMRKKRDKKLHDQKMQSFFDHADGDNNHMISWEDFKVALRKKDMKAWLSAQELDISDPELLWYLIAGSKETELCKDEFVTNMSRLRGSASRADVRYLTNMMEEISMRL